MGKSSTPVFLSWVRGLLTGQLNQDPDADFIKRLDHEIERSRTLRANLSLNHRTYELVDLGPATVTSKRMYRLFSRGTSEHMGPVLHLTPQQGEDLSRQLDAPVDYFND